MSWLVWDSYGQTEADARRIDEQDCVSAAEEWARREGRSDPVCYSQHLAQPLDLRARCEGSGVIYRVVVEAEAVVHYHGREGWTP